MDIFNDDLDILEIIFYGFPRRVNERRNFFEELDNLSFFKTFRLYKETVREVLEHIEQNLEYPDHRQVKKLEFFRDKLSVQYKEQFTIAHTKRASLIICKFGT